MTLALHRSMILRLWDGLITAGTILAVAVVGKRGHPLFGRQTNSRLYVLFKEGGCEMLEVYSEKLGATIIVPDEVTDNEMHFEDTDSTSLVGWTHGGWNNSGGGGSW